MAEFFRKLFGGKSKSSRITRNDSATTAPLSSKQVEAIINSQNVQYEFTTIGCRFWSIRGQTTRTQRR